MKILCFLVLGFISPVLDAQNVATDTLHLSISYNVDQQNELNQKIITTLKLFLETQDSSYTENKYWSKSDFEKYITPYSDLEGIEAGKLGKHYYQPSLMEIIETDNINRKIVKIAFIGHNDQTKANVLKAIYNIVATNENGRIVFSEYMDYMTRDWQILKEESILYKISPCKAINYAEVLKQKKGVNALCNFLNTNPVPVTFYSCTSPKELFELLGFDYHPNLYNDTSGGWSRDKNIVISANKSEYYMHEVTHIYLRNIFPSINAFFNEGFATYTGGSGKYDYQWQREKLKKFFETNPNFRCEDHVEDPYERLYYEHETPVPYMLGALICERTLRLYGKEKLFDLFRNTNDVFDILKTVGLTKENIDTELRKEIDLPPLLFNSTIKLAN
ncbi:MAG TPA: hypothetical protein VG676_12890 [Chitinophagaceae bacterium]|nr:hypothetical protein [Chitinophagaceae bacterium]